ncbi:hypothetical protein HMPREF3193_00340 [Bifidobacterium breve]|nr:hypothetical protein HMPREF3193_00340 [Bifidobacterium breve]
MRAIQTSRHNRTFPQLTEYQGFSVTNVHFAAFHPHTFLIENDSP